MNFKVLHQRIKEKIANSASGFKYVPADKWLNVEFGHFPQALVNNSFMIKFPELLEASSVSQFGSLNVEIECVLNAVNDGYLEVMDDLRDAVFSLRDIEVPDYGKIISIPRAAFKAVYIDRFVIITFTNINILIN